MYKYQKKSIINFAKTISQIFAVLKPDQHYLLAQNRASSTSAIQAIAANAVRETQDQK